ncbi:trigger factor [Granulicatella balaenopterae]|uniref:Trigger factor n=1 Tax=Granulicatella balaenopterae TaxID=137733 RepID=A0A1H9LM94_9LACT|nr:trigger factor [Granulicatella balaenopterae]SER12478.1 trigger factor [Granulicatella balaenopterae]
MTVSVENIETNKVVLTFEISEEEKKQGLDKAFNRIKKNLNIPGFRKGKVNRQVFNKMYGEVALYEDALNIVLPDAYDNAVEEAGIYPVTQPKIDIVSLEQGTPWVIKAEVIVKPEVKLGEFKNLTVEKQDREVSDKEVEDRLLTEQANAAELVIKEGKAELGDTVVIDFEGFLGDEAFEGGKAENHALELGSGSFIPGFEDQLVGTSEGEAVEVKVTFPEDYQAENLKGQEATFKVTVHEVKAKELPELNDEFAKDIDDEVETLDELKAKFRKQLEEQKEAQATDAVADLAVRKAVENAEIVELPQEMVDEEVNRQVQHYLNDMRRNGIAPEMYFQITNTTEADLVEMMKGDADVRTKTNLVLEQIVKDENIEVSDEDVDAEVKELAAQYNMAEAVVRSSVSTEMLKNDIAMKKALAMIVDTAKEA